MSSQYDPSLSFIENVNRVALGISGIYGQVYYAGKYDIALEGQLPPPASNGTMYKLTSTWTDDGASGSGIVYRKGGQIIFNGDSLEWDYYDAAELDYEIIDQYTDLLDTPDSFVNDAGKALVVNATEDRIEHVLLTVSSIVGLAGELNSKANASEVYDKNVIDGSLSLKADADNVYDIAIIDSMMAQKADVADMDFYTKDEIDVKESAMDSAKADKTSVYTINDIDGLLNNKADKNSTYTKTQVDGLLATKLDASTWNDPYSKTETDALMNAKADLSNVYSKATVDTKFTNERAYTDSQISTREPAFTKLPANKIVTGITSDSVAIGNHLHSGVYEPAFTKNSAFNKNFTTSGGNNGVEDIVSRSDHKHDGEYEAYVDPSARGSAYDKDFAGSGTANTVSRSDHSHTGVYEPVIIKNSAFNKPFGTTSGTVMEGDHRFDNDYMPKVVENTAYNKNFYTGVNSGSSSEVARSDHSHTGEQVSIDNSSMSVVVSGTTQGAIADLDGYLSDFEVAEKSKINLAMSSGAGEYTLSISTSATYTQMQVPSASLAFGTIKNASYSNGIQITYPVNPSKLIEGIFSFSATIRLAANQEYEFAVAINGTILQSTSVKLGSSDKSTEGTFPLSLSSWIGNLNNNDVISIYAKNNTGTSDIVFTDMMMSWAGQPEGSLLASSTTIYHSDLLGTGAPNGVHTIGDIQGLQTSLDNKISTVVPSTANNIPRLTSSGGLEDSGVSLDDISSHMDKDLTAVSGSVAVFDSSGNAKGSTRQISNIANVDGDATQAFNVDTATSDSNAVPYAQLTSMLGGYTTSSEFGSHTSASNPHGTTYSDVGAAASSHSHTISDIGSLQSDLDAKMSKLGTFSQDNFVSFDASGNTKDSGKNALDFVSSSGGTVSGPISGPAPSADGNYTTKAWVNGRLSDYASDTDLTNHTDNTSNPHSVTKAQVGLGNVNNTSDADKPVSTATQALFNSHTSDTDNPHQVTAAQVGADPSGSANAVQIDLNSHKNNTSNPHNVTYSQVGALPATGKAVDSFKLDGKSSSEYVQNIEAGTHAVLKVVYCTQAEYDALTPASTTLYVIKG